MHQTRSVPFLLRVATQLLLASVTLVALVGPASAVNLVQNGSFEEPVLTHNAKSYAAGSTDIVGWRVTQNSVDLVRGWTPDAHGEQCVDLNGSAPTAPGGLSQDITITTPGDYILQFAMSAHPQVQAQRPMRVTFGSLYAADFQFDPTAHAGHGPDSMKWDVHTVSISVPASGTYALSFVSTTTSFPAYGPVLDNVSLSPAPVVPEPASVTMFGTGLVSLLALRRRKR